MHFSWMQQGVRPKLFNFFKPRLLLFSCAIFVHLGDQKLLNCFQRIKIRSSCRNSSSKLKFYVCWVFFSAFLFQVLSRHAIQPCNFYYTTILYVAYFYPKKSREKHISPHNCSQWTSSIFTSSYQQLLAVLSSYQQLSQKHTLS